MNAEKVATLIHRFILKVIEKEIVTEQDSLSKLFDLANTQKIIANLIVKPSEKGRGETFVLDEKYEDKIFRSIFFTVPKDSFYHYTSLENVFAILNSQKLQISSIAGMNDKSETDFVDKLLGRTFKNPLASNRIEMFNRRFILCFSGIRDHFNQWRLYGNDCKGACLCFKFKQPVKEDFYIVLGKVVYGNFIPKLVTDLYREVSNSKTKFEFRRLFLWKNFMKHEDYSYENEIRLLLFNSTIGGKKYPNKKKDFKINYFKILVPYVTFDLFDKNIPIDLTEIQLGPKCPELKLNEAQFRYYLNYFSQRRIIPHHVDVSSSTKDHYRTS